MRILCMVLLLTICALPRDAVSQEYVTPTDTIHIPVMKQGAASTVDRVDNLPEGLELQQNYPNPFNPGTTIRYQLPTRGEATIRIYDARGREVMTLVRGVQSAGRHMVRFDGSELQSGTYHYRLSYGEHVLSRSMVLLK